LSIIQFTILFYENLI